MYVHLSIVSDNEEETKEDNVEIFQTLMKIEKESHQFFPKETEMKAFLHDSSTWIELMNIIVQAVEKHYGYPIKEELDRVQ